MNAAMKDILNVMSTFLTMGMDLPSIIKANTWNPSVTIKRPELGNLSVGSEADVTVLNLRQGKFGFWDRNGVKLEGNQKFECEMSIKAGRIVYDLNGIADPVVVQKK
jgi:dihydroorotase